MAKTGVLELAILGMLEQQPLHGYEIRKQLGVKLGAFRALSYGSLYPALKRMVVAGLIAADGTDDALAKGVRRAQASAGGTRRSKIAYRLTPAGVAHLKDELATSGAATWEDDAFDVRFSLFGRTDSVTRLRILEGRRTRLIQRLEDIHDGLKRVRDRHDAYTAELQRHGLEQVEREVEWLDRLIDAERAAPPATHQPSATGADVNLRDPRTK